MIEPKVSAKTMICPLTNDGTIYALQNENGEMIGTGTRVVCEVLRHIIDKQNNPRLNEYPPARGQKVQPHNNVRSAIVL